HDGGRRGGLHADRDRKPSGPAGALRRAAAGAARQPGGATPGRTAAHRGAAAPATQRATDPQSAAGAATASGRGEPGAPGAGLHPEAYGTCDDRAAATDDHHNGAYDDSTADGHDDTAASPP